jgi:hypothetical protein
LADEYLKQPFTPGYIFNLKKWAGASLLAE